MSLVKEPSFYNKRLEQASAGHYNPVQRMNEALDGTSLINTGLLPGDRKIDQQNRFNGFVAAAPKSFDGLEAPSRQYPLVTARC